MSIIRKKVVLWVFGIAVICAIIVAIWVFRKAPDNVASVSAEVTIEASILITEFERNEQDANAKYLGKVIEVSGNIASVSENVTDKKVTVTLNEPGVISGVLCEFSSDRFNQDVFKIGDKIKVKGVCTGYLMDVVLTKCVVVKK